ncbi:hypothetical protein QQF64_016400 [Cirrhinus molitorella]|uniref:Uncharacterized protein n=1 Tax=Cirrhinus molitorella TaxID=172907 RepID=A0ABR3LQ78_9TELE
MNIVYPNPCAPAWIGKERVRKRDRQRERERHTVSGAAGSLPENTNFPLISGDMDVVINAARHTSNS